MYEGVTRIYEDKINIYKYNNDIIYYFIYIFICILVNYVGILLFNKIKSYV